ncbi:hypothetical protein ASPWEDRAFT_41639 [Aspergillus wentii DTO 134E9]|uniref:TECPR1-like DysF domain-containing protein n=1 Tax=Aspergillus wentii DTO 134E9 TaxID=1073089 RepID=A0A1L9RFT5_ASPWE|nr:uncharacterized protein ASPWEDRAFT_41639 [Aspergillus wentii DTO 134E9]KAI9925529.1 hypothetical protein MW887_005910 [Aspergillus wentii]OJJ33770.1 hypothetical protein ASPWEDRAFT_41639 [Aspergillus wentii DTO 134E9]
MDESTPDAFVNRNEPIPVLSNASLEKDLKNLDSKRKRSASVTRHSLQDRLFAKLLQQVIPADDADDESVSAGDKPISAQERPAFSLPLMTNNFRRFNARIGIVFSFQNQIERLLSWKKPSHTVSFLFVYSFICLDPHLLAILPIAIFLLFVMVPAFLARHPPPPSTSTSSTTPYYSYEGPALAPAKTIEPASETSKDFFRNLRDLQNCMADFSDLHDATISMFAPLTDFSNEKLSSATFLVSTIISVLLFPASHLFPWRLILLVGGNAAILSNHPRFHEIFQSLVSDVADEMANRSLACPPSVKDTQGLLSTPSATMSTLGSLAEISLDSFPEEREVEIFELQYRSLVPYAESQWDHFLFSPMPYDPLSPYRIAGDRPRGCRFFEDVRAPSGWAWKSKKWELDLDCREWVVERMITGVGFEIPGSATESSGANDEVGGWVWDHSTNTTSQDEDEEVTASGYGDLVSESKNSAKPSTKDKLKEKGKAAMRDWEERSVGLHGMGEWRRRRWVRIVHRVSVPASERKA